MEPRRRRAAELLAVGLKDVEVARQVGIGTATLRRWKHDPAFVAEVQAASERISTAMTEAIASVDRWLANEVIQSLDRIVALAKRSYERAFNASDPNEAVKWGSLALRADAIIQAAYLRRFARKESDASELMENIVNEAVKMMLSGELDEFDANGEH